MGKSIWIERHQPPCCINNKCKRFQTFESNRFTIIHSESYPKEWRYINRREPADDGSKGLKARRPFEGLPMNKRSAVRMERREFLAADGGNS